LTLSATAPQRGGNALRRPLQRLGDDAQRAAPVRSLRRWQLHRLIDRRDGVGKGGFESPVSGIGITYLVDWHSLGLTRMYWKGGKVHLLHTSPPLPDVLMLPRFHPLKESRLTVPDRATNPNEWRTFTAHPALREPRLAQTQKFGRFVWFQQTVRCAVGRCHFSLLPRDIRP
jgi:hypothetical protein